MLRMVPDLPLIDNESCNNVYGIVGEGVVCMDTTGGKAASVTYNRAAAQFANQSTPLISI